ncbi:MAG: ATP-binding protein [Bacteroidales bacterium]|nr:ATP-binding protein [Bacteroidales bacterium]
MVKIIGRDDEIAEINELYFSDMPHFLAIYGRRRVGKTFLIDEALKGRITFRHSGLSPVDEQNHKNSQKEQLKHFYLSLQLQGMKKSKCPTSWLEAFFMLEMHLQSLDNGSRQVVFLDELPWMDTPRSGFITALEAFWNGWGCHRHNFMLIVCGSATSWITDKLINNHGGLYGRLTHQIKLSPFTLNECEKFFQKRRIKLSRYDIVQSYMALGGIPYYLSCFEPGQSLAQNIDRLFFRQNSILKDEFDRLFASVFSRPDDMKKIVEILATRRSGYTQSEIAKLFGITAGGSFSAMLKALVTSDFIQPYVPFGKSKREEHYKLIDPFCLFYLKFVKGQTEIDPEFWMHNVTSQRVSSWRGFAFEEVCFSHFLQIKKALDILGVSSTQSAWAVKGDDEKEGTQIDLLINRKDNVVNLCEMKFYNEKFTVSKPYYAKLVHRQNVLSEKVPRKTVIHNVLVTTEGLTYNEYSGIFQKVVTIDDLFGK